MSNLDVLPFLTYKKIIINNKPKRLCTAFYYLFRISSSMNFNLVSYPCYRGTDLHRHCRFPRTRFSQISLDIVSKILCLSPQYLKLNLSEIEFSEGGRGWSNRDLHHAFASTSQNGGKFTGYRGQDSLGLSYAGVKSCQVFE